jgi:16S rRNA G1207 methylase RsmC
MGVDHQLCNRCGARGANGSLHEHTVEIKDIDRVFEYCEECDDIDPAMFLNTIGKTDEEIEDMTDAWNKEDDHTINLTLELAKFLAYDDEIMLINAKKRLKAIKDRLPALKKKNKRDLRRASHEKWLKAREAKAEERQKKIDERRAEKIKATAPVAVVA